MAATTAWYKKFYLSDVTEGVQVVQLEKKYKGLPIYNPLSTKRSIKAKWSFIADMVVRLSDGLWLVEYKTASQLGNDYIAKLDIDNQVSSYITYLEKELNEPIRGIIYRVLKKPSIRLKKTETPTQFLERLESLFAEQSEDYLIEYRFRRSRDEINEFKSDLWNQTQYILAAHRKKTWPRNTQSCVMYGRCEYFPICKKQAGAELMFKEGGDRNASN